MFTRRWVWIILEPEPQIYLLLSGRGVSDDLPVRSDGAGHATEQAAHGQTRIHQSHAGCIQAAGQELRTGSGTTPAKIKAPSLPPAHKALQSIGEGYGAVVVKNLKDESQRGARMKR